MEFGRVKEKELEAIDFSLPQDPETNKLVLKGSKQDPVVYNSSINM